MERVVYWISLIMSALQIITNNLISLAFQPLYFILQIIQNISDLLNPETEQTEDNAEVQPQVTVYPSTNEGKYAEEVDYPACQEQHIGFKINQAEKEELDKIKEELNK